METSARTSRTLILDRRELPVSEFLAHAVELITDRGYKIANIDATVLAEGPKLRPYIQSIRESLALVLRIDVDQVNVKAKTNEDIESIGRGEAMAP